jgi:hypothetical protein
MKSIMEQERGRLCMDPVKQISFSQRTPRATAQRNFFSKTLVKTSLRRRSLRPLREIYFPI